MNKHYIFHPRNVDPEELILIEDNLRATQLEIKDIKKRKAACNDPESIKQLDEYMKIEEKKLKRLKDERRNIYKMGFTD
jgi:DNA-binding transcriptional MerR regulator